MSSSIAYWLFLTVYLSGVSLGMAFFGVNWYKVETRYKRSPQRLLVLLYTFNILVLFYGFKVPFLIQFIINILQIVAVYFGSQFQVIGLTGGISTGKSTVSGVLAENGFDIIDADKISKEVSAELLDEYFAFVIKFKQ